MMKISLFIKPFMVKVCLSLVLFIYIVTPPSHAEASFFSDIIIKIFGAKTLASEPAPTNDNVIHNSQNVPLLESSVNPDLKNIKDEAIIHAPLDPIVLANNGALGVDSDLEKYASSEKISTYVVVKGDTLEGISAKLNVPQSTILSSNADLKKSDLLKIGQKLVIIAIKTDTSTDKSAKTLDKPSDTIAKKEETPKTPVKDAPKPEPKDEGPMIVINTDLTPFSPAPIQTPPPAPELPKINLPIGGASPQNTPLPASGQPNGTINGNYIWPFSPGVGRISQGLHADNAYDFSAPKGTTIYAIQSGTVLIAHPSGYNGGYGKYVVINFDDGRQAIFGHMNKTAVEEGQIVKQGDIIGYVGSTGKSTGPHVHIGFHGDLGNPYLGLKVNSTSEDFHD